MKYIFLSEFLESGSLALRLKLLEKWDVKVFLRDKNYEKILKGLIDKEEDFTKYEGSRNLFITDDASSGELADSLRKKGELVFGGSVASDLLENKRMSGQRAMKDANIDTPPSTNFKGEKAFDEADEFVRRNPGRWVFKQNEDVDKSFNHVGKFEDGADMLDHLKSMRKSWTENVDFDIQEFIPGIEFALEGWFNGKEWVKDTDGEEIFIINWEHKKRSVGDLGATTGETCTLQCRLSENSPLKEELFKITPLMQDLKYIGNVDLNFILSERDDKLYGLEWTNRFGYPSLNMHEEMIDNFGDFLWKCAKGENNFVKYPYGYCAVIVLQVPPFPFQSSKPSSNARGQRVYFVDKGEWRGKDKFDVDKLRHIHPYEVRYDAEQKGYFCTGDQGYLLTVTGQGETPFESNENALNYLKENVWTKNMEYRTDCGVNERVQDCLSFLDEHGLL